MAYHAQQAMYERHVAPLQSVAFTKCCPHHIQYLVRKTVYICNEIGEVDDKREAAFASFRPFSAS